MRVFFKRPLVINLDKTAIFLLAFFISAPLINLWLDKMERRYYGVESGVILAGEDMSGLLPAEVRQVVEGMAIKKQVLPLEPCLDKESGRVIPGRNGQVVNVEKNIKKVLNAPAGQELYLDVVIIHPRYKASDLELSKRCIGAYATGLAGSFQRITNISLASESLNNTVVWPGKIFSFNDVVGPRTPERGYMPAPVILMGATDIDYGGGVCQVASTTYNAMLKSGLKLVERHAHSKPVQYVPEGRDATVGYGYMDLKFLNHYSYPVIVKTGMNGGRLEVLIYGRENK